MSETDFCELENKYVIACLCENPFQVLNEQVGNKHFELYYCLIHT